MKTRTIGYWATTGLVGFAFAAGGIVDLARGSQILSTLAHLGYPPYFATLLGVWKVLGAVALLAPRFPRLKEWAYAGIAFDLSSAVVSHLASGDGVGSVVPALVLLALAAASWALRPESRRLANPSAGAPRETDKTESAAQPGAMALSHPA